MFRSSAGQQEGGENTTAVHNSHWLSDGGESRYVGYYDAASLYPSSSKSSLGVGVGRGRRELTLPPLACAAWGPRKQSTQSVFCFRGKNEEKEILSKNKKRTKILCQPLIGSSKKVNIFFYSYRFI